MIDPNDGNIQTTAALLTIAATHRRQIPPEQDDPEGAINSVLSTYQTILESLSTSSRPE